MTEDMARVLVRYYGLSEEGAREVAMELRDKRSLRSLAGYRVARAVRASTPPNDLEEVAVRCA